MAKWSRARGSVSQILDVFIQDSASTTGAGKTGLTSASAGLVLAVKRELAAAYTVYAQASSNLETITTIGTFAAPTASKARIKEIDATNAPGMYQIMLADALFDTGDASRFLSGILFGASGMAPVPLEIELTATDNQDGIRGGLTALPNSVAWSEWIFSQCWVGVAQAGTLSTTQMTSDITGWGDDIFNNRWMIYWTQAGSAVYQSAIVTGYVSATGRFTFFPALTAAPVANDRFILIPCASGLAVGDRTGNLSGSVGSVVGNVGGDVVGDVQGDVQGNVVGSVASVTGDIGGLSAGAESDVRDAVGLAAANLDTQLAALAVLIGQRATPAQVAAALDTTAYGEPTGVPGASVSLAEKIGRIYQALRNQLVVDTASNELRFYDDSGVEIWKKALTDDGTTYTEAEGAAP